MVVDLVLFARTFAAFVVANTQLFVAFEVNCSRSHFLRHEYSSYRLKNVVGLSCCCSVAAHASNFNGEGVEIVCEILTERFTVHCLQA